MISGSQVRTACHLGTVPFEIPLPSTDADWCYFRLAFSVNAVYLEKVSQIAWIEWNLVQEEMLSNLHFGAVQICLVLLA